MTARFSDFTGIPTIPDNVGEANPRGFAVKFKAPGGDFDIVTHSFNGFPTKTAGEFRELLLAIPVSGKDAAKPTALDKFLAAHPIAKTFLTSQKSPESFATSAYFGVNAFKFTKAGHSGFCSIPAGAGGGRTLSRCGRAQSQKYRFPAAGYCATPGERPHLLRLVRTDRRQG